MELQSTPGINQDIVTSIEALLLPTTNSAAAPTHQAQSTALPAVCGTAMASQTNETTVAPISILLNNHGVFQIQSLPTPSVDMATQELLGTIIEK